MSSHASRAELADLIDAALPQTQCRRCGYDDCRAYAEAVALDGVAINRCPPGGAEGIARLAAVTGRPVLALDPATGSEGPFALARIDEAWCIGCTLCIAACPVDCIVGAPKRMHVVVAAQCTGCGLCVPACPVDCIAMAAVPGADPAATGWAAWSEAQAAAARERHDFHRLRLAAGGRAAAASPEAADDARPAAVACLPRGAAPTQGAQPSATPPGASAADAPAAQDATATVPDAAARLRAQVAAAVERARRARGA